MVPMAHSGLPMIVSNPDIVRPGYDNDPMPGLLGQAYERKGGRVIYVGKPYPLVYERCRCARLCVVSVCV